MSLGLKMSTTLGIWVVVKEDSLSISAQGASTALCKGIFFSPTVNKKYTPTQLSLPIFRYSVSDIADVLRYHRGWD